MRKPYISFCVWMMIFFLSSGMILSSCGGKYEKCAESSNIVPTIFPDYTDVTVPVNIAPLNFEIKAAKHVKAIVEFEGKQVIKVEGSTVIDFPEKDWKRILGEAAGSCIFHVVDCVFFWQNAGKSGRKNIPAALITNHFLFLFQKTALILGLLTALFLPDLNCGTEWEFINVISKVLIRKQ